MFTRRLFFKLTAIAGAAGPMQAFAQGTLAPPERLALKGYDPVAYFTIGEAVPGVAAYEHVWDGMRYRFASGAHRELFRAQPEKFAPQFGGSCAMSLSTGVRREADPRNWVISNGSLYVFAGAGGVERFRQAPDMAAVRVAENWKSLKSSPTQ